VGVLIHKPPQKKKSLKACAIQIKVVYLLCSLRESERATLKHKI
jgi:hypothetical protein